MTEKKQSLCQSCAQRAEVDKIYEEIETRTRISNARDARDIEWAYENADQDETKFLDDSFKRADELCEQLPSRRIISHEEFACRECGTVDFVPDL